MSYGFNPSDADYDNLDAMNSDLESLDDERDNIFEGYGEYDETMRARDMADEEDGVHWSHFEDDFGDDDDNVIARWYDQTGEWELVDDAHYPDM